MQITLTVPRLLPLTIGAIAAMLLLRAADMAGALPPIGSSGAAQAAEAPAPAPATTPAATTPAATPAVPVIPPGAKLNEPPPPVKVDPPPSSPPMSESERSLLQDLRKRRIELDEREQALTAREAVLSAAQTRLTARLEELNDLQKRLEALEMARREHDDANWRGMVRLYETMKPKDAAAIFNDLDPAVLLPVLDRMKESKAAAVLAAMLPDRARTATTELAQMRAKANTVAQPAGPPPAVPAAGPAPAAAPNTAKTAAGS